MIAQTAPIWTTSALPAAISRGEHSGGYSRVCHSRVRLTFPKGAQIKDGKHLFNARLDSNSVRAIDFHEGDRVDEAALNALIVQAVRLNTSRVITR